MQNYFSVLLKKCRIPKRANIAVMLFFSCFISYMMRVNMSINIIAMVVQKPPNNSSVSIEDVNPNFGTRYNWSVEDQGIVLGAYFWGYLFTSLPGGVIAEKFGGKAVNGYTLLGSAILTALTPLAANIHLWAVIVIRFLIGVLGGFVYPANHCLISKWAPPDEKGKFIAALMGGTFGTVVSFPLSGTVIEAFGWSWAFYFAAVIGGVVVLFWFLLVADSPSDHKTIDKSERMYIEDSLGNSVTNKKSWPPFISLITSLPFLSLLILHYGNLWGLYFFITAAPKFMSEVLGFKLAAAGFLSGLPYFVRFFSALVFGIAGDILRRRNLLSVTMTRKSFCLFSHIIPGIFLIVLAFFGKDPYVCVAIITLSLGFNGAAVLTNLQNSQDLAPNYAGTLYGIINFAGTTAGFIAPIILGQFTKERNTLDEWKYVFLIGAAAYMIPAVIFWFLGSGDVQYWNNTKKDANTSNSDAVPSQKQRTQETVENGGRDNPSFSTNL